MSLSPLLIKANPDKPKPVYYVYYDEWSGDIKHVTNRLYPDVKEQYLKTDSEDAAKLIKGEIDRKKYMVTEIENVPTLIVRHEYLSLKKAENALSIVPVNKDNNNRDLNIVFYNTSYKMEINLSEDLVYKMTGTRYGKKLQPTGENFPMIDLWLINRKNPQLLLKTVRLNPFDLIEHGYKLFDLSSLQTKISLNDVYVLTKRIFHTYGIKRKETFTGQAEYGRKKQSRRHVIQIQSASITNNKVDYMFSVSQTTGAWIVKSNFLDPTRLKIYRDIELYVTRQNPNYYLGKIHIPLEKIGNYQELYIKTDIDLLEAHFIVKDNNKNITFKHEELDYVQSSTNN